MAEILVTENDTVSSGEPLIRLTNTREQLNTDNAQLSADYYAAATNSEKLSELQISIKLALAKMKNDALLLRR